MSDFNLILAIVLSLTTLGGLIMIFFARRMKSSELLRKQFGAEYDLTVRVMGDEKKALTALKERLEHVESLGIHPLTDTQRNRYLIDWAAVQFKFVDEPAKAILDADRLIMEVMQLRAYPVSDFEQRAADVSVSYPALITNYRAARAIALKNTRNEASTEELRQAMIHYHSLFDELLETPKVAA